MELVGIWDMNVINVMAIINFYEERSRDDEFAHNVRGSVVKCFMQLRC